MITKVTNFISVIQRDLDKWGAGVNLSLKIPIAFPATYRDQRMIAQRSCFTIHGEDLKPIKTILRKHRLKISDYLFEYRINIKERSAMLKQLNILGISAATIVPDLDHLAKDLKFDVENL